MPAGPVTYRVASRGPCEVDVAAWGPGAGELLESVPRLFGEHDDAAAFRPRHPLLAAAHRRLVGLRVPRTNRVLESLIPAILEQRVVGPDATAAWRWLVRRYGDPAPGPAPAGMRVMPPAATWRRVPSWDWHRAGVDGSRSRTVLRAAGVAERLDECAALPLPQAYRRLTAVPGIGVWTAAQVGCRAFGDADALPIGDYNLTRLVGWALAGRRLGDEEIVAFMDEWRPHRYRVVRLLELTPAARIPRFGPRLSRQRYQTL